MSDRVDKAWFTKGIETYSVPAILGTLAHYGLTVTEESFLALTKEDFPLTIAQGWHEHWKGTGQFSRFPGAAAEELWRRLNSAEIAPTDLTLAMVNLLTALNTALDQKPDDGTWDARFKIAEGYLLRVPAPGDRREKFMAEMVAAMGQWLEVLDGMAEALAKKSQPALADRFCALEEALFPVRQGTATALVKAAKGDVATAMIDLMVIAGDAKRDDFARLSAIDALVQYDKLDDAKRYTLELVDRAEQEKDVDLASEAVERLTEMLRLNPKRSDRDELRARVEQLARVLGE
jgi:polyhydroxyalkanoate synthesis regulator phasin